MWVIKHEVDGLFWSNRQGWTDDIRQAERFTASEVNGINLPMEGVWHQWCEEDAA